MKCILTVIWLLVFSLGFSQEACENASVLEVKDLSSLKLTQPITYLKVKKDSSLAGVKIKGNYSRLTVFGGESCSKKTVIQTIDSSGQFIPTPMQRDQGYCYCETCIERMSLVRINAYDIVWLKIEGGSELSVVKEKKKVKKSTQWYDKKYKKGDKIQLPNIMFYAGTDRLQRTSFKDLDLLLKVLKNNQEIRVEIQGHVNGPRLKNKPEFQSLSEARAKTVMTYLIKKGIEENRLTSNGYGNTRMIFPNAQSEFKMQFNRRVEILVL